MAHSRYLTIPESVRPVYARTETRGASRDRQALADEWSELAVRVGAPPFLHPGWITAWERSFADRPVSVLTVRRDRRLVGLVPLLERSTGLVSPTNWHTPQFGLLAEDDSARRELAQRLAAKARHRLDIGFLESGSQDLLELRTASAQLGHRIHERTIMRSPYVRIDGEWSAYERHVGGKRLRELRRRLRKLENEGSVSIDFVRPTGSQLATLLSEGFAVEGSDWKSEQGTAILSRAETERFYTDVAHWAAANASLVLGFVRVNDRPVAFDMCLEAHGRISVLKGGFDTAFRAFAPRTILLHASLERAFRKRLHSYEFLGADDDYKLPWSNGIRLAQRLQTFPGSPTGLAGYLAWRYGRAGVKRALSLRERVGS